MRHWRGGGCRRVSDADRARGYLEKLEALNAEAPEARELEGAIAGLEKARRAQAAASAQRRARHPDSAPAPILIHPADARQTCTPLPPAEARLRGEPNARPGHDGAMNLPFFCPPRSAKARSSTVASWVCW